jgi:hypothetical protein
MRKTLFKQEGDWERLPNPPGTRTCQEVVRYRWEEIMHRVLKLVLALLLFATVNAGCASNTKTVRTETSMHRAGEPAVVERETVIKTSEPPERSGGLLSGTVNVVGEVLALPFRAAGGLIRVVF